MTLPFVKAWNFLKLDPTKDPQHPNAPHDTSAGQHEEVALTAQEQADEDIVQEKFDPYKAMTDAGYLPKDIDWLFPPGPDPETPEDTERLSREP